MTATVPSSRIGARIGGPMPLDETILFHILPRLWFAAGTLTLLIGHWLLLKERNAQARYDGKPEISALYLFWEQIVLAVFHPWCAAGLIMGCYTMSFLILPLILLENSGRLLDMRQMVYLQQSRQRQEEFKERYGMEWRIISTQDAIEHGEWRKHIYAEEEQRAVIVAKLTELSVQAASFAILLLSLMTSSLMFGVKKATAGEREDEIRIEEPVEKVEKPFEPKLAIHGVTAMRGDLIAAESEPEFVWSLAQADLKIIATPAKSVNLFTRLGLATFSRGGTDPVLASMGTWTPTKRFSLQAGRIISPVGFSRQPPGEAKVELSYPTTAITSPLFDHGVIAQMRPIDKLALDLGLVTGHGTEPVDDTLPDIIARAELRPTSALLLGASGQAGSQVDGWRKMLEAHTELKLNHLLVQTEGSVAEHSIGNDVVPSAGWWGMIALRPTEKIEPYTRLAVVNRDLRKDDSETVLTSGVNLKPDKSFALRGALELPLGENATPSAHLLGQITF